MAKEHKPGRCFDISCKSHTHNNVEHSLFLKRVVVKGSR